MGLAVQSPDQYEKALRKLFPRGRYWDRQFADPGSDCSMFCKAKVDELIRFRSRMSDLQDESVITTAGETLDDWERVIGGAVTQGLEPDERRALLHLERTPSLTIGLIKELGYSYGFSITDVTFPFRPAFCGFSRFARDRIAGPASFSVLYIYGTVGDKQGKKLFENNYRRAAFGFARFGVDRAIIPLARSAITLYLELDGDINWGPFKARLEKRVLAHYTLSFMFGGL
jgi:uncharacterized protein YmfQ (DUF2313 family)